MHHKWRSYDVRFLRYGAQQTEFFVILGLFLPIYPTNNLRKQKFEKRKKKPGDIIILHLRTANDNHMIYGSWDMERNRQNFFSLWTTFCPFTPWHPENQNFDKMKKRPEDIIILQKVYHKLTPYDVRFLRYEALKT